jgi:hypothetical protein
MDSLYSVWNETCNRIVDNKETGWKRDREVYAMLEHVPGEYSNVYLDLTLLKGIPVSAIQKYTSLVDSIGNSGTYPYIRGNDTIHSSSTCLRYLYHAVEIVDLLTTYSTIPSVVEIGGGYGGLSVAIDFILTLRNVNGPVQYTILDLPGANKLQKYYTDQFTLNSIHLKVVNGESYGFDIDFPSVFIISNYCLAEMGEENRGKYIQTLFTKSSVIGGYLQWNSGAPIALPDTFLCKIEDEHPQTGPNNKTVIFNKL